MFWLFPRYHENRDQFKIRPVAISFAHGWFLETPDIFMIVGDLKINQDTNQ
jgi:hypothetical protein